MLSRRKQLQLALVLIIIAASSAKLVQSKTISQLKCDEFTRETEIIRETIALTIDSIPERFVTFNCSKTVDLIVGGVDAGPGEFPHQALLGWNKTDGTAGYVFRCGGTLISERFVLTAAHCMSHGNASIVRLGETDLTVDSEYEWDTRIEFTLRHPKHLFSLVYHDIALIKLVDTIRFSFYIRPACLWHSATLNETASLIVTGFGKTENTGVNSKTLRKVQLDFLNRNECVNQYRMHPKFRQGLKDSQLCVGNIRDGKSRDACQGDSGGPVQIITEPKGCTYHVLGVTSIGTACGVGRSPSIYTRVASYINWIEEVVWGQ